MSVLLSVGLEGQPDGAFDGFNVGSLMNKK